jgi:hypothetical protein
VTRPPLLLLSLLVLTGVLTCQRPPPTAARHAESEPEDPEGYGFGSSWARGQELSEEERPKARPRGRRAAPASGVEVVVEVEAAPEEFDSSLLDQVDAALEETRGALGEVRKARGKK